MSSYSMYRSATQKCCSKRVETPAHIRWQPPNYPKTTAARFAFKPLRRHLVDAPTQAMYFYQQLDAVAKPFGRLYRDMGDHAARKKTKAVCRIARGDTR